MWVLSYKILNFKTPENTYVAKDKLKLEKLRLEKLAGHQKRNTGERGGYEEGREGVLFKRKEQSLSSPSSPAILLSGKV